MQKADYKKYYSIINYAIANNHMKDNNLSIAFNYCRDIIKHNPTFVPAYNMLIQNEFNSKNITKVTKYLQKLWLVEQSYEAILLFNQYYIHFFMLNKQPKKHK